MADRVERDGLAAGRRTVLKAGGLLLGSLLLPAAARSAEPARALPRETAEALHKRALVYVSPLRTSGEESRCHGEVWFFMDGGDVVIGTDPRRWKGVAVKTGRTRTRIRVQRDERESDYRKALRFDAEARIDADAASFDRLLAAYGAKYSEEWGKWGPRFRKGREDGTRVLIRYTPIGV
jgi:hypothetical protein